MPAIFGVLPGAGAGIYLNSGNYNTPTWGEQTLVKDVEPQSPWTFAEAQGRDTPVKLYAKTTVDLPLKVTMRADQANSEFAAWVAAHWGRETFFDLLILNGKNTDVGACGVRGSFVVSMTEAPQPIDGTIYATFELRPTEDGAGNFPTIATVANTGNTTYTSIVYGDIE